MISGRSHSRWWVCKIACWLSLIYWNCWRLTLRLILSVAKATREVVQYIPGQTVWTRQFAPEGQAGDVRDGWSPAVKLRRGYYDCSAGLQNKTKSRHKHYINCRSKVALRLQRSISTGDSSQGLAVQHFLLSLSWNPFKMEAFHIRIKMDRGIHDTQSSRGLLSSVVKMYSTMRRTGWDRYCSRGPD